MEDLRIQIDQSYGLYLEPQYASLSGRPETQRSYALRLISRAITHRAITLSFSSLALDGQKVLSVNTLTSLLLLAATAALFSNGARRLKSLVGDLSVEATLPYECCHRFAASRSASIIRNFREPRSLIVERGGLWTVHSTDGGRKWFGNPKFRACPLSVIQLPLYLRPEISR